MNDLLTPAEAAARLKVHVVTLGRWRRQGKLPGVRYTDGTIRYRASDLDAFTAASVRWETAKEREPQPIQSAAPAWLDLDAVSPLTGLTYRVMQEAAR